MTARVEPPYSAEDVIWAIRFLCQHAMDHGDCSPIEAEAHAKALEIRDWFRFNFANASFEK